MSGLENTIMKFFINKNWLLKRPPSLNAITLLTLTAALTLPCTVQAVSIGGIELQSKLGEALHARINLITERGERIDSACLSLAVPDPLKEDISGFVTAARLTLKSSGKQQYINVSSSVPFDQTFAKLRLQVKCPGLNSVSKTLLILPSAQISNIKQSHSEPIGSKSSNQVMPQTHEGIFSETERTTLLTQQQQLKRRLLEGQIRVKQLEDDFKQLADDLNSIRSTIAKLDVSPVKSALAETFSPRPSASPPTARPLAAHYQHNLRNGLFFSLVLILTTITLWMGLRHYTETASFSRSKSQRYANRANGVENITSLHIVKSSGQENELCYPVNIEYAQTFVAPHKKNQPEVTQHHNSTIRP